MARYLLWLLPATLMAFAAVCALGFWGSPVESDLDGSFSGFEFGGGVDQTLAAVTIDRQGLAIEIDLDPATFKLMCRMENREIYKDRAVNATLRFGDSGEVRRHGVVTLRGRGSLRKSSALPNYNVKMIRPVPFGEGLEMKRMFLMNLYYDKHQMEVPVAYRLLSELGLFPLHFQFVRLTVAGKAHGMYLLVEPPVSGLRRAHPDCVSVFRRARPNAYDTDWAASVPGVRAPMKRLRKFVSEGGNGLGACLDEVAYFSWLSVNALLRNADSLDELFLYERRAQGVSQAPLQVLAWDYDDIIDSELKPGALSDPLLFGCLDPLEFKVAADPDLYGRYRKFLKQMLATELSMDRVEKLVREVQAIRDGLDDGSDVQSQRRARRKRAEYSDGMLAILRGSHRELTRLTQELPASPPHDDTN